MVTYATGWSLTLSPVGLLVQVLSTPQGSLHGTSTFQIGYPSVLEPDVSVHDKSRSPLNDPYSAMMNLTCGSSSFHVIGFPRKD